MEDSKLLTVGDLGAIGLHRWGSTDYGDIYQLDDYDDLSVTERADGTYDVAYREFLAEGIVLAGELADALLYCGPKGESLSKRLKEVINNNIMI